MTSHDNCVNPLNIDITECVYTQCYCEENVWKLCEKVSQNNKYQLNDCSVVFISNHKTMVPLWQQSSGNASNGYLTVWDYHVIMVYSKQGSQPLVFDFDTELSFPEHLLTYCDQTFRSEDIMFRVIPSQIYLTRFASDRSRMRRPDGSWIKPPPEYDCITTTDSDNNIQHFISMDKRVDIGLGSVLDKQQFISTFA